MNEDRLRQLLQTADRAARKPESDRHVDALVAAARTGLARRKRRESFRTAAGAVTLALIAWLAYSFDFTNPAAAPTPDHGARIATNMQTPPERANVPQTRTTAANATRAELAALRDEAAWRADLAAMIAQRLDDNRRAAARLAAIPDIKLPPTPTETIDARVDQVAKLLLDQAEALRMLDANSEKAARQYRLVIDHFPKSQWSAVARERLSQLKRRSGARGAPFASPTTL